MPVLDWQFIVVTLIAAGALLVLVRRFMPARARVRGGKGDPACAHCASNESNRKASARPAPRTATTPVVSLSDLRDTARRG
jgi:hypothetical protein